MADKPTESVETAAVPAASESPAPRSNSANRDQKVAKPEDGADKEETTASKEADSAATNDKPATDGATENTEENAEKPTAEAEAKTATETPTAERESAGAAAAAETPTSKGKNARRKSAAGESKGKTLNRKGSKARLTHTDAQPGDHFLIKLKGFPAWPAIICDESMLPIALVNSRPVAAARADGTYTEAYADGGKRMHDRSFPVMYLYTNEFGWVANTALSELTAEKAKESITDKMRKDLREAYELAAEHHSVDHYKDILKMFQEELIAQEEAKREAAATPKKSKKSKAKDEDVDMVDAEPKSKSKKRKADDDTATPQRTDSAKKPKIKLNTSSTPKTANGTSTPKTKDGSAAKASKPKQKKAKDGDKKAESAKEAQLTPAEKRARKEKEVLYLRHKLQRGLLTRDQQPSEDEMKPMSDYITMLENFVDLEVSIIRTTKINKVLKAILKLNSIPRESEFDFKGRSQKLLDKWNKLLATDGSATNGVNGDNKSDANGVKDKAGESKKADADKTDKDAEPKAEDKDDKPAAEPVSATAD